jgi:hypothetical protein
MLMLFNRAAIVPMWLVVFGLFVMFESPMTFATGVVLFLVAGVALAIMLVASQQLRTHVPMTAPVPPLAMVTSAEFVPNSWPNSGFRNSRQRGTKGR